MANDLRGIQEPQGKATFIIEVECQDNATWQGKVTWTDESKEIPFRSAMELLEIMNTAFDDRMTEWE